MSHTESPAGARSRVFWVTSEAIAKTGNYSAFVEASKEIVGRLARPGVENVFQNPSEDLARVSQMLDEEARDGRNVFITPEPGRYSCLLGGERTIAIGISRVVRIPDWKTGGHRKRFPQASLDGDRRVFLDTVAFTGRTIEEVRAAYGLDLAIVEIKGKYAPEKLGKLGVTFRYSTDASGFDGMWHLDDLAQGIETCDGVLGPAEFLESAYPELKACREKLDFADALKSRGIKREQTSPSLLLELARPGSYLAWSFHNEPWRLAELLPLFRTLEGLYAGRGR